MAVEPELERIPCFALSRYRMERELSLSPAKRRSSTAPSFASAMELLVVPKSIPMRGVRATRGYYGASEDIDCEYRGRSEGDCAAGEGIAVRILWRRCGVAGG